MNYRSRMFSNMKQITWAISEVIEKVDKVAIISILKITAATIDSMVQDEQIRDAEDFASERGRMERELENLHADNTRLCMRLDALIKEP